MDGDMSHSTIHWNDPFESGSKSHVSDFLTASQ
ncbi:hypothetical protein Xbed_00521 [Xenorhabdus beddingii]|uniref:Uncharacterized protein n=1 Tax=Xenorhabdus beddingii TaxID=40578 RepID=A0A1Y2SQD2_9GAMM|nr:hypothetical protein Xbed_00521 [Xenorhabdus beddingii]